MPRRERLLSFQISRKFLFEWNIYSIRWWIVYIRLYAFCFFFFSNCNTFDWMLIGCWLIVTIVLRMLNEKAFFFSPINCSDIFIKNKQKRRLKKVLNNKIYLWIIFMSNIFLRNLYVYHRAFFFFRNLARFDFFIPRYILICMIVKLSAC